LSPSKKAGLLGLFCCAGFPVSAMAAAEPLAIEVTFAQAAYDAKNDEPLIIFKMSDSSKKAFADLTRANVAHKLEIRIDGKAVTAPVIVQPIFGGTGQVVGHFTVEQARDIAARLNAATSRLEGEIVD
jgi:SecD/SecF fusion protein